MQILGILIVLGAVLHARNELGVTPVSTPQVTLAA